MRVVANSIPKSGTHLLDHLLVLLGFRLVDFGGIRPHLVEGGGRLSLARRHLRTRFKRCGPNDVLGIGPHLIEGNRFLPAIRFPRKRGKKVAIGVVSPQLISRRWLARRLSQIPPGGVINAHCLYTSELAGLFRGEGMKVVCILRDPRDVAVSQMHYLKQLKDHFAYEAFTTLPSDDERLMVSIRGSNLGGRELLPLDERYRRFLGWEQDAGTVVVKFEDLVGPKGGGSVELQRRAVERVAAHVGLSADERTIRRVEERLFGMGRTFRKGQIGGWQEEFLPEHKQAVKEVAGALLIELGYEADLGW